jgi:CRP-like cAMP-binding protein
MSLDLRTFLMQYSSDASVADALVEKFRAQRVKRNAVLLREGERCRDLIFIKHGCARMFYTTEETDVSVWFAFDGSTAIDLVSFISDRPSEYNIQAVEDTEILVLPRNVLQKLYADMPGTHELIRRLWEDAIIHLIERFTKLQKLTAKERYHDLLQKPEYLARIPQKYLASFIGVTPTSFSRIRAKIKG